MPSLGIVMLFERAPGSYLELMERGESNLVKWPSFTLAYRHQRDIKRTPPLTVISDPPPSKEALPLSSHPNSQRAYLDYQPYTHHQLIAQPFDMYGCAGQNCNFVTTTTTPKAKLNGHPAQPWACFSSSEKHRNVSQV